MPGENDVSLNAGERPRAAHHSEKTTGLILSLLSTRSFTNESFFRSHRLRFQFSVATYWLLATHFASATNQADVSYESCELETRHHSDRSPLCALWAAAHLIGWRGRSHQ